MIILPPFQFPPESGRIDRRDTGRAVRRLGPDSWPGCPTGSPRRNPSTVWRWPSRWRLTSSPVDIRVSNSRGGGGLPVPATSCAILIRSSVVSPIAETTATRSTPSDRCLQMRVATFRMRSGSARELPPNFCTITGLGLIASTTWAPVVVGRSTTARPGALDLRAASLISYRDGHLAPGGERHNGRAGAGEECAVRAAGQRGADDVLHGRKKLTPLGLMEPVSVACRAVRAAPWPGRSQTARSWPR